ncbi:MAG: hypothetical protein JEZ09_19225 [Salinivirgaceae bacterium]|nr:hypothetical protein [Salinivirgaceae bacterium]
MKAKDLIFVIFFVFATQLAAQEVSTLFKAKSFSEAFFNPTYQELKQRKAKNLYLSDKEIQWLELYQSYVDNYFKLLNDNQQSLFYQNRANVERQKDSLVIQKNMSVNFNQEILLPNEKKERDTELLLGHIAFSGASGIAYGSQLNYILDIENTSTRIGLTMLLSGGSMLIPIFSPRYDNINSNSLWLRGHGKVMGGLYGYFLSAAMFGDDILETNDYNETTYESIDNRNKKPISLSMSLASSIALGQLGFYLGNTKPWTDGRIATYQYYSYALPALASGLYYSFSESTHLQAYGLLISASVPLGYFAAHQLSNKIEYTRGDMTAIINNSVLGGMVGGSVLAYGEFESSIGLLWPIGGAVLGSFVGHYTYRNFHITRAEGRRLNYAAFGGGLIGLGTSFLIDADEGGTYLLISSLFAATGYGLLLNHYYKQPRFTEHSKFGHNIDFALHPESLLINKHLPAYAQAPLFSMRIKL